MRKNFNVIFMAEKSEVALMQKALRDAKDYWQFKGINRDVNDCEKLLAILGEKEEKERARITLNLDDAEDLSFNFSIALCERKSLNQKERNIIRMIKYDVDKKRDRINNLKTQRELGLSGKDFIERTIKSLREMREGA